mgnify:CR=1 FL=1
MNGILSLNRTSVGLKQKKELRNAMQWAQGLNRTSVGLKPRSHTVCPESHPRPQSNQRGIETLIGLLFAAVVAVPQSNQRGIETRSHSSSARRCTKPQSNQRGIETRRGAPSAALPEGPQSNQRGIETRYLSLLQRPNSGGLNRTSVGLKHGLLSGWTRIPCCLNRTSVGLKPR